MHRLVDYVLTVLAVAVGSVAATITIEHFIRGRGFESIIASYDIFRILGLLVYSVFLGSVVFAIMRRFAKKKR